MAGAGIDRRAVVASAFCRVCEEPPGRGDTRRRRNELFGVAPAWGIWEAGRREGLGDPGRVVVPGARDGPAPTSVGTGEGKEGVP